MLDIAAAGAVKALSHTLKNSLCDRLPANYGIKFVSR
jgi:hypothetical protein